MPSGRTHDRITRLLTPAMLAGAWHVGGTWQAALSLGGAFVFAGLMFSGDLDLKSVQYRRWGYLRFIWLPYQRLIRHRSPLSHGLLLGPAVRLGYVVLVLGVAIALGMILIQTIPSLAAIPLHGEEAWIASLWRGTPRQPWLLFALAGLWLGGASHTLADWLVSAYKRRFGPLRPRRGKA